MFNFILAIQIVVAIAMVGLILLQHGKGADAGASFGSGASGTVFGAAGSANFLTRATAVLTAIFFATSLLLAIQARKIETDQRKLDVSDIETETTTPSAPPTIEEPVENVEDVEVVEELPTEANTTNAGDITTVENSKTEKTAKIDETAVQQTTTETTETKGTATKTTDETKENAETEMSQEQIEKQLAIIQAETEKLTKELDKSE